MLRKVIHGTIVLALSAGAFLVAPPPAQADGGCTVGEKAPDGHVCFPTAAQCATGAYNGVWEGWSYAEGGGQSARGAYCYGYGGSILYYGGGVLVPPRCGVVIVANQVVLEDTSPTPGDPNSCP